MGVHVSFIQHINFEVCRKRRQIIFGNIRVFRNLKLGVFSFECGCFAGEGDL
jgi:hypothetical protein